MTSNIKNIWPIQIGEVGVNPNYFKIECTDSLGTITAAGYMPPVFQGYSFGPQTVFFFLFGSATTPSFGIFVPTFSKTVIGASTMTLNAWVNQGVVTAPVTSGDLPKFSGTTGLMVDSNIAANTVLTSAIVSPDISIDLVSFDITVGQAALATGGSVTLQASSGSKQYKIKSLQLNSGGTNFSGGGGDRLGQVTDGTTVYSVIPAATMQSLANAQWGATALPNPAAAAINTSTAAGSSLVFKYSGGTTDYTAGSLVISGLLQRIA